MTDILSSSAVFYIYCLLLSYCLCLYRLLYLLFVQMIQAEGMSCEDAEQRIDQVSSDMQAIIGTQLSL